MYNSASLKRWVEWKKTRWSGRWCKTWAISPEIVTVQRQLLLRRPSFLHRSFRRRRPFMWRLNMTSRTTTKKTATTPTRPHANHQQAHLTRQVWGPQKKISLSFVPAEAAGHACDHPPLFVGHPWNLIAMNIPPMVPAKTHLCSWEPPQIVSLMPTVE